MHSARQRLLDILASAFLAVLTGALLTATSTIIRGVVLNPCPIVSDVRVSSTSALYRVRSSALLSSTAPDASAYYLPVNGIDAHSEATTRLPSNIEIVDTADSPEDNHEDLRRKALQRANIPRGFSLGIRTTERVSLFLSGTVDFSPCWDWNTKAIYVSFIARFSSKSVVQNDVTILDAVLRPVSLPAQLAQLAEKRRQERRAASSRSDTEKTSAVKGPVATPLLTNAERQQLADFERTLRSDNHDHPSLYIDHIDKRIVLKDSFKYYVDAFDDISLGGNTVEVVLRYQVMSYSGWAPLREDVLGHQVKIKVSANAVPWEPYKPGFGLKS
ncbi:hypothetical protein JKF63_06093 [Porcisia hertigi]|uniref:Signal peptidase complex subunit 3 n=1 Tax=Porcisia hertigi TaxID=2761500 RepID=A0A836INY5_9TRYP|nr:hypothetical protein JKF63_06093 [Porcisia hertigi]